ncbi:hypothetical protein [Amycolatopsis sp. NPDC098790]|uniref:hypothetical protein n=1 Tax=Amycolatopsis sp. NPDC098790 TaxID=3363939 RepID=UPI003821D394
MPRRFGDQLVLPALGYEPQRLEFDFGTDAESLRAAVERKPEAGDVESADPWSRM